MREEHADADELESYSLGRLTTDRMQFLEEHLLICEGCRVELTEIELLNFIHYTNEGEFYSRITRLRSGKYYAHHWGCGVEGGREFRSRTGARAFLMRSFAQMFAEHICEPRCGSTAPKKRA